jgi:hypothetical protein
MKLFIAAAAILTLDLRRHYKSILLLCLFSASQPVLYSHGVFAQKALGPLLGYWMLNLFTLPMVLPWWIIGLEREDQSMRVLLELPISRITVAVIKATICCVTTALIASIGFLSVSLVASVDSATAGLLAAAAAIVIPSMSFYASALYLALPSRIVLIVIGASAIAAFRGTQWLLTTNVGGSSTSASAVAIALIAMVAFGVFILSVRHWSQRISSGVRYA